MFGENLEVLGKHYKEHKNLAKEHAGSHVKKLKEEPQFLKV